MRLLGYARMWVSMNPNRTELFSGGEFVKAHTKECIALISPVTEQTIGSIPDGDDVDVDTAVRDARVALPMWRETSPRERAGYLYSLADAYDRRRDEMVELIASQNGSPHWFGSMVNGNTADSYRNSARSAENLEIEELRDLPSGRTLMHRDPLGVIGIIVPWNAPQTLLASRLGAALAAGCTVVAKPSPETALGDYLLAEMISEAGIPRGVVNIVPGGRETGGSLVRHPGTDKIAFVGSVAAARDIAAACGAQLKPVSAELGGKSAAIVLEDADPEIFRHAIVPECLPFSGQVCYSLTRVIVPSARHDEVLDLIVSTLKEAPLGDPSDPATIFGPLISNRQRERVEGYIQAGIRDGATLSLGSGKRPKNRAAGFYVEPTVFDKVHPEMSIFQEEIFGPVLVVTPYDDECEAINLANNSDYGLSGAVFGSDVDHATDIARQMEAGRVLVNAVPTRLLRGYKNSGLERENGMDLTTSYLQVKGISQPQ
jgi:aldehyde dehydrogenase (NAD+)